MPREYMTKVIIPAAATVDVPIPTNGAILGVYASAAVTLSWVFNGDVGQIVSGVTEWEPKTPFAPGPFSTLRVTTTTATDITIRTV